MSIGVLIPIIAAILTITGNVAGGAWAIVALVWLVGAGVVRMPSGQGPDAPALPVVLAILHFLVLYSAVYGLGTPNWNGGILALVASGLYLAQVSNSAAHELIHSPKRGPVRLGIAVFASILFGHHYSAHRLVHHIHVATENDPNTARKGTTVYGFIPRAWLGSFSAGLAAEKRRGNAKVYWLCTATSFTFLIASGLIGGVAGLLAHLALAFYASTMLLVSDYVQHYGLKRMTDPNGKVEPVGPQHSWDAPPGLADHLMLNAPRHASHHVHPARGYGELDRHTGANTLPYALSVMIWIAFLPRLWRRLMDKRLDRLAGQARA